MKNRVERAALEVLLKHNIRSLPIKLVPIANNYGIRVKANTSAEILKPQERGKIIMFNPPIIVLDDTLSEQIQRFTLAHEIGHWVLGHLGNDLNSLSRKHLTNPQEKEAERFAARLLAPACVLWGLNLHTPQEIATFCNISMASARIVACELKKRYERENPFQNDIEIKVFENFKMWIDMANTVFGKTCDFAKYEKAFKQVYSY